MKRRTFIRDSALLLSSPLFASSIQAADPWSGGRIRHIIPLASHNALLIKVSFATPQHKPGLRIGPRLVAGKRTDTLGRFWTFLADDLDSDQEYELSLRDAAGTPLAESWPLRTAPAPDADIGRMRLLIFSCAAGPDHAQTPADASCGQFS